MKLISNLIINKKENIYLDIESNKRQRVFLIVTWGACGSNWLAKTLNGIPEIFCTHHLKGIIQKSHLHNQQTSIDSYLNLMLGMGENYSAVGDVHGFTMDEAKKIKEKHINTVIFSLIREPIARATSAVNLMVKYGISLWGDLNISNKKINKTFSFQGNTEIEKAIIYQVNNCNSIKSDLEADHVFRAEDLWSNSDSIYDLVVKIYQTDKNINIPAIKATNTHTANNFQEKIKIPKKYFNEILSDESKRIYNSLYNLDFR